MQSRSWNSQRKLNSRSPQKSLNQDSFSASWLQTWRSPWVSAIEMMLFQPSLCLCQVRTAKSPVPRADHLFCQVWVSCLGQKRCFCLVAYQDCLLWGRSRYPNELEWGWNRQWTHRFLLCESRGEHKLEIYAPMSMNECVHMCTCVQYCRCVSKCLYVQYCVCPCAHICSVVCVHICMLHAIRTSTCVGAMCTKVYNNYVKS